MFGLPDPRYWYVNTKEREAIEEFYKEHLHTRPIEELGTISSCPYHIEIKPNNVSYSVTVVCDVCAENKKLRRKNIWIKDVTDYDSW